MHSSCSDAVFVLPALLVIVAEGALLPLALIVLQTRIDEDTIKKDKVMNFEVA